MSEPDVDWYIHRIKAMLGEIDKLVFEDTMTNSKREIISSNTNEIEINLHTIIRKLKEERENLKIALDESIILQAHYAQLLNMHDGGQRSIFPTVKEWMERLKETGTIKD